MNLQRDVVSELEGYMVKFKGIIPTELECEKTIIDAARMAGWRIHGERAARTKKSWVTPIKGHAGWPDLALCRDGVLLCVELKRKPAKPAADQLEWLEDLAKVPGVIAMVLWVPDSQDWFCERLFDRTPEQLLRGPPP